MNSNQIILEFIEDYRCHPSLWDTGDINYLNKNRRNDAYAAIAAKHNMDIKTVKAKIKNLRSYYSKETQKMLNKKSGSGAEDNYVTTWFAYNALKFISDSITPKYTRDSMTESSTEESYTSCQPQSPTPVENVESPTPEETFSVDEEADVFHIPRPLKRSRNVKSKTNNEREETAFSFLQEAAKHLQKNEDSCGCFGQLVASQMRQLDQEHQSLARNQISNILFKLEMKQFEKNKKTEAASTTDENDIVLLDNNIFLDN